MMESRRSFVKKVSRGAALSALAVSPSVSEELFGINQADNKSFSPSVSSKLFDVNQPDNKPVRIGIIGAENSHTIVYGKMFNINKEFPGVEVLYVWGETEEFAKNAAAKGGIPNIVIDPLEMMGKIDALIVDHRHPKYHLPAATPFVKAGIPTFIDKPFCYRVSEGKKFLEMAESLKVPVTSFSSVAHSDSTFDIKKQVESMDEIKQVVMYGTADINSPYGGIFFYGVHSVQTLMYIFGDDIIKARITRNGNNASASLAYSNGILATVIFKSLHYGWEIYSETKEGIIKLESRVEDTDPQRCYTDMVEMFRTGKEPRSHESILKCAAVLEALEKSVKDEKWKAIEI
jgi:predicted dehydrogenase